MSRATLSGWRPALRIARRDALRARGRSALILAMIALPVITLSALDVLHRTNQLDPDEKATRQLGRTQAMVLPSYFNGPAVQHPNPLQGAAPATATQSDTTEPVDPLSVVRDLPGYRVLTAPEASVEAHTEAGLGFAGWNEADLTDAAWRGRYDLLSGRAPRAADEVAVTPTLLDNLGAEVGDTVRIRRPAHRATITGVVAVTSFRESETFFAPPGTLIGSVLTPAEDPGAVYLAGPRPVTWRAVQALNRQGVLVYSRHVLLDPPPKAEVPYYRIEGEPAGNSGVFAVLAGATIVGLAALEVCLLAGAAFAVGTRRQARALALVAATGGTRRDVRRIVLAGGVVLGLAAGIGGVLLGIGLAVVSIPALEAWQFDFGRLDVRPLELAVIATLGLATGVLSAVIPARTASRQDPVAALSGRRGQLRTPRKVPVIGVVVTAVGIGAAMLGSSLALAMTTGLNPGNGLAAKAVAGLIAGGAGLTQIGLIIGSPAVIGLAGRWAARLPLAARLALRDAARHRGRSAPALAAILTAVTGSTSLLLYVAAIDARDRDSYQPQWPAGHAAVQLRQQNFDPVTNKETVRILDPDQIRSTLEPVLPPFRAHVIDAVQDACIDECAYTRWVDAVPVDPRRGVLLFGGSYGLMPVGGAATLRAITDGVTSAEAEDVLARGGVVTFVPGIVRKDGTVRFAIGQGGESDQVSEVVSLPGRYLRGVPRGIGPNGLYSPGAAERLDLPVSRSVLLLDFARRIPTKDEEEAARAALVKAGVDAWISVERGYQSDYGLGLVILVAAAAIITLGATGIATGLAQADARADQATLAAVGAAPRIRRRLAGAQALSLAWLGSLLGIGAGFVPALALVGAVRSLEVTIPWVQLAIVLVGIPLLAGATAYAFTRSRVPMERRVG